MASILPFSRRLRHLCWEPSLWTKISLQGESLSADLALSCVLATLAREGGRGVVRAVELHGCPSLSDHGLGEVARHCPSLQKLDLRACRGTTNSGVAEVVARCPQLQHLNLAGSSFSGLPPGRGLRERLSRGLALTYLDLTDCSRLEDTSLRTILQASTQVLFLYLRRCVNITGNSYSDYISCLSSNLLHPPHILLPILLLLLARTCRPRHQAGVLLLLPAAGTLYLRLPRHHRLGTARAG